ncbi:unnamed protein product [Spodoptera littoralis]|uniref:Carboxylesterase type B domain-containing protein n=1 Tax=Spodoptera littoralis TaxID=7109 RepID=A0A9P0N0G8_SPOLI|nr:unnamed protein product [Spodoptera littoralis]CAH1637983.1 unnamed protein product [Spodoptera littoralis]
MRWKRTALLNVVLVVATSALHLTVEHGIHSDQNSTSLVAVDETANSVLVSTITHSEDFAAGDKADAHNTTKEESFTSTQSNSYSNSNSVAYGHEPIGDKEKRMNTESLHIRTGDDGDDGDVENNGNDNGDDNGEDNGDDNNDEKLVVDTSSGKVRGHIWRKNENIISYIDIKYGTFNSLFEAPVAPNRSTTVHEIKEHASRCPQLQDDKVVGDKDCLTLSIFKPPNVENASVLVHIHEGNFIGESANPEIYGPEYLIAKQIILVLPNYRLGPLGFLCMQDKTAPGNAALKDLSLALTWVKTNIKKFGGNPGNIAVSGIGTAGALAGYLALSPMSHENVHKVIIESGSVLSHWAIDRDPIDTATRLSSKIENFKSFEDVDLKPLLKAAETVALRPCLEKTDKPFMTETPWKVMENKEIKIPFMMGTAKYAGVHEFLSLTQQTVQELNEDVGLLLPNDLHFTSDDERTRIGNRVKTEYFGEDTISLSSADRLTLYYTDAAYLGPALRTARPLVSSGATVYFYEFSFVGEFNRESHAIESPIEGAVRGDIVGYIFTQDGIVPAENTGERSMVECLVELWTSFINTGTPTSTDITWEKFDNEDPSEEHWLSIDTDVTPSKGVHVPRMTLWTEIYKEYFIERNLAYGMSPSVCTVLLLQAVFFITFFRHAWHFF